MKTRIKSGLEKDLADVVEREFNASHHLRKRVREMLTKDMDNIFLSIRNEDSMSGPNWVNEHASKIGEARALAKIISLLE